MKKRYVISTLGCRTNQYESQAYIEQLKGVGYSEAKKGEQADVCVVNTCTVTETADKKSFYQIRRLVKEHPNAKVVVTGCMAKRKQEEIESLGEAVQVVANEEKELLLPKSFPEEEFPEFSIKRFEAHTRAFVKVQDGCNSFCSYCVIPYVRGRSRSKRVDEVVAEVRDLIESGYKEVVLTGINIGDFDGGDGSKTLADLVREVDAVDGLKRLRISSIDPDEVDDALLDAVMEGQTTCPSMHIVLQSGSNKVLKRMNRKYTRDDFFQTTERLLAANPDFTFTTDIIVGFPGEEQDDFEATLDAVQSVRFSKVHMFPFSVRPQTRAARYTDFISKEVINERKAILVKEAEQVGFTLRDEYVGKTMSVLVESEDPNRPGYMMGHTENFLTVSIPADGIRSNDLVDVEIGENEADGLKGEVCQLAFV